jgi:nucleoid DNA-binding protein
MIKLTRLLSKKTGIPRKDLDALLKVISYEIIEELRTKQYFQFPELGLFTIKINHSGMCVKFAINQKAKERLNKKEGERSDEIVFD